MVSADKVHFILHKLGHHKQGEDIWCGLIIRMGSLPPRTLGLAYGFKLQRWNGRNGHGTPLYLKKYQFWHGSKIFFNALRLMIMFVSLVLIWLQNVTVVRLGVTKT